MNKEQYLREVDSLKASAALKADIQMAAQTKRSVSKKRWIVPAAMAAMFALIAVPVMTFFKPLGKSADMAAEVNMDTYADEMNMNQAESGFFVSEDSKAQMPDENTVSPDLGKQEKSLDEISAYFSVDFSDITFPYGLQLESQDYFFYCENGEVVDDAITVIYKNGNKTVKICLAKRGMLPGRNPEECSVGTVNGYPVTSFTDENGSEVFCTDVSHDGISEVILIEGMAYDEIPQVLNAVIEQQS